MKAVTGKALTGVRVLAIENFISGPYASMWMADSGAEVIKIEPPQGGDQGRGLPPLKADPGGELRSISFLRANRNKKSITLDLKTGEGRKLFLDLVRVSDIVLENLRPDAMAKLGLDYPTIREVNPRLIYVSITGFGQEDILPGPYGDRPAFDIVAQAMSGLMCRPDRSGDRPVYLGFPLADVYASTLAVAGAMQALYQRTVTGQGQHVDIAMYDGALALNELSIMMYGHTGQTAAPGIHALSYPFGCFKARDGYVAIAVHGERTWQKFCTALDRADLAEREDLANGVSRHRHGAELQEIIEGWLADKDRDHAVDLFQAHGVPVAPVQDVDEVFKSPQALARKMLLQLPDPAWGEVTLAGNPIKASGSPDTPAGPAPGLGEHTEQLLGELLGLDSEAIARLRGQRVV